MIVPEDTSCAEDLSLIHHGEEIRFDEIGDITDLENTEDLLTASETESGLERDHDGTTVEPETKTDTEPEPEEPEDESEDESQTFEDKYAAMQAKLDD